MSGKSLYLKEAILNGYFGSGSIPAAPATLYVALLTTSPTPSSDSCVEVSGGSYARVAITNNSVKFPAATQSGTNPAQKQNAYAIIFPTATADLGTVVAFGIYDAPTGGNLLYWGAVYPTGLAIMSGMTFQISASNLTITEM
jgi:hypothetical protein